MRSVNIHDAKTHLSKLVDGVATGGEGFIIAKAGKPLVKVVPLDQPSRPQGRIGFLRDAFQVPDDFKDMGRDDIAALFAGGE